MPSRASPLPPDPLIDLVVQVILEEILADEEAAARATATAHEVPVATPPKQAEVNL